MQKKRIHRVTQLLTVVTVTLMASGCATHSDRLGFADSEGTKTYAQAYEPARQMMLNGQWDALRARLNENSSREIKEKQKDESGELREITRSEMLTNDEEMERLVKEQSELAIVERGLMTLNVGDFPRALFYFNAGEEKLGITEADSSMSSLASKYGKTSLSVLTGSEELSNYEMRGYEKVMLLNYKALCYMLMGERKAYNVTRRAIDLQQEEWEKFRQLLAENESKLAKEAQDIRSKSTTASNNLTVTDVDDRTEDVKKKAELVASAYVNPFGDYLNAMMMEIDGLSDATIRQNARIAYEKVVENNPDCSAAAEAVNTVEKGVGKNMKLVQIILSDGFSPYQVEKTRVIKIPTNGRPIEAPINYANATPVPTLTNTARVTFNGKTKTLSSLTKMESLILRDEADRMPLRATMLGLAVIRSLTSSAYLGELGAALSGKMQHPDTRSWLTLPNQVYVARIQVPKSQNSLKLETLDAKGNVLASSTVKLAAEGPTVVYAVSYDKNMQVFANAFSWVD